MKQKIQKLLALALTLCMLTALIPVSASAATTNDKWNIILVIDCSGSLIGSAEKDYRNGSDNDGLRYEAISALLDILHDGNNVGAVMFAGNTSATDAADKTMRGNNEIVAMRSVNSNADRDRLLREIEKDRMAKKKEDIKIPGVAYYGDNTDIGTAMLMAEEILEEACSVNQLPGAIFLFTDGKTDLKGKPVEVSQKNLEEAIERIKNNNVMVCGCYLNKGGKEKSEEVRNIVAETSGIPSGMLGDRYTEITDSASCTESILSFMRLLGYSVPNPDPDKAQMKSFDEAFLIPGVGIDEISIFLYTVKGKEIPVTDVRITKPGPDKEVATRFNTELTILDHDPVPLRYSQNHRSKGTYLVYKIVNPEAGEWNIHVELPEDNEIGVVYDPVYSLNVDAAMEMTPAADLHANMEVTIQAFLEKNGSRLTDPSKYYRYECAFVLADASNPSNVVRTPIDMDGSGAYVNNVSLPYGQYDASIEFSCGSMVVSSRTQELNLQNHTPEAWNGSMDIKTGLFQKNTGSEELLNHVKDVEDGKNVTFEILNSVPGASIKDGVLELDGRTFTEKKLDIRVTDTQGAYADFSIDVNITNYTVRIVMFIAIVLLLVIALILIWQYLRIIGLPKGDLKVSFTLPKVHNDRDASFCVDLSNPGSNHLKRKTNLYDILVKDIDEETSSSLWMNCHEDEQLFESACEKLKNMNTELRKIQVSVAKARRKPAVRVNKKVLINMPQFGASATEMVYFDGDTVEFQISYTDPKLKPRKDDDFEPIIY